MMANYCTLVSQAEISSLKDTLCAQQKLLQQLYHELEAEREASATAASEALSVILRLQGEKAAVKMEAEQYKRLAEEKMGFAEESFAIIEDMITEKEMEVAELDYQVQTYRYQLMSMGFDVPAVDDTSFPEHLFHRNDCLARESSLSQLKGKMAMIERESSTCTDMDFVPKHAEEQHLGHEINEFASDLERKADVSSHEGISCFAEQIKQLQLRVNEISGANIPDFINEPHSPLLSSQPSAANLGIANSSENRPPTVHDVFEVPQADESMSYESPNKDKQKEVCQSIDILESQDQTHLKKLLPNHDEKTLCKPSDVTTSSVAVAFVQTTTNVDVERPAEFHTRGEELKLLKEIREQLNALQGEIAIRRVKKSFAIDKPSLQPLSEVMHSFWL